MQLQDLLHKWQKYDIGFYAEDKCENIISHNENRKYEAASCIKLFILIEYYKQIFNKKINLTDPFIYNKKYNVDGLNSGVIKDFNYGIKFTSEDLAMLMVLYSDNIATNILIDYLGIDNINNTIQELGFKNTKLLCKLNLLKYKKFGVTTPKEYAMVYKKILNDEIYNKEISSNVLNLLKKQSKSDILNKSLPQYDLLFKGKNNESVINYVASKSGCIIYTGNGMKNCRNDGGIISTIYGDYVISIFISDVDDLQFNYDNEGINCGAEICRAIFEKFIKSKGNLR